MNQEELCYTSAADLAAMIRERAISPVEVTDAVLARIDTLQPVLNAFITVSADEARAAAREAEAALSRGDTLGPLHGVPFSVKDLVNTAGVRTTFGSYVFEHNVPEADAVSIKRLKDAGAILVGKTTTPEFGHKSMTYAPLFGHSRNPWDLQRTPGGSSGGAAAAAAAGLAPLAVGTDGGGSIRIPAACCGVVGLKTTLGRIPHDMAPEAFGNLSYIGPMTRTVMDIALMLDAMAGPDPSDMHSLGRDKPDYAAAARPDGDLKGVRIAWRARLGNEAVDHETLALCEEGVRVLAALGATVETVEEDFEASEPMWRVITFSTWRARFEQYLERFGNRMDPTLVESMQRGTDYSAIDLQHAQQWRTRLFRAVQDWFTDFDLVVTPTLSRPTVALDQDIFGNIEINGEMHGPVRAAWYPYTHPFNMTGHPAITVPCGWTAAGLPVGLQLVGPWLAEDRLLRTAALYEAACPWAQRRPPLDAG